MLIKCPKTECNFESKLYNWIHQTGSIMIMRFKINTYKDQFIYCVSLGGCCKHHSKDYDKYVRGKLIPLLLIHARKTDMTW